MDELLKYFAAMQFQAHEGITAVVLGFIAWMIRHQTNRMKRRQDQWEKRIDLSLTRLEGSLDRVEADISYERKKREELSEKFGETITELSTHSAEMEKLSAAFSGFVETSTKRFKSLETPIKRPNKGRFQ